MPVIPHPRANVKKIIIFEDSLDYISRPYLKKHRPELQILMYQITDEISRWPLVLRNIWLVI